MRVYEVENPSALLLEIASLGPHGTAVIVLHRKSTYFCWPWVRARAIAPCQVAWTPDDLMIPWGQTPFLCLPPVNLVYNLGVASWHWEMVG